jgi:outer membrane protein W
MSNISTWFYAKWVRSRIASGAISELKGAKMFLKYTGATMTPDAVRETLRLSQSGATLGRKFRYASADPHNPELAKSYYTAKNNREVVEFYYNPNFQEDK